MDNKLRRPYAALAAAIHEGIRWKGCGPPECQKITVMLVDNEDDDTTVLLVCPQLYEVIGGADDGAYVYAEMVYELDAMFTLFDALPTIELDDDGLEIVGVVDGQAVVVNLYVSPVEGMPSEQLDRIHG